MEAGVPLLQHVQVSLVDFSQLCTVATHASVLRSLFVVLKPLYTCILSLP